MRICILQTAFTNPHAAEECSPVHDPGNFTDQHTFDHGYDFYFNFMWGQHEDDLSGIDACKYFESLGLPSVGQRSEVLERSKNDLYKDARALGYPRVPGTTPPDSDSDSASSNIQTPSSSSSSSSPEPYSLTAVQAILPTLGPFDHILNLSVLYFLSPVDFSLTMVRSFQLARKSLVGWIDEIPETYMAKLLEMGPPHSHMIGFNQLEDMEKMFCNLPPPGWKLAEKFRQSE
ncbi:uncharacterized protein P174DRAFT_420626 [Aspergillus novofumigatus IBT 16806]|uniref:Uncharacterized protein n=1 Tax=Aspergillus novofumigatus (strain IBT 16806) TaxID=1392255 RepID=A0A2I1C8U9_ASPN1|nr:uncharacterized protein P174DRAFT_420626 [Aspergillus novofumigatus IBT 16806]PKX94067.1 hypothetical protein P174DRAFT_420626 [Aspergillus novofumigatus IBT 16806]